MRSFIICFIIIASIIPACMAQPGTIERLIREGIELHDKGDYEGAIKKYDAAILMDKDNYQANYEKSLSCMYAKRFEECEAISKFLIGKYKDNPEIKNVYCSYGSAVDDKGDFQEAIKIYNEGIKRFPGFYLLHFNKGLTYSRQKKWNDAELSFMEALKNKPDHPGSLYYMALINEHDNKVAAVLSCLTFLALEPEGKRAEVILGYLNILMSSFAKKGDNGNMTITVEAGDLDNKKKENNFSMTQMILGLTAASSLADSVKAGTEVEMLSLQVQMLVNSLSAGKKEGRGIYWEVYAPFFIEMKEKDLIPVFAHIAYVTSGKPDNIKWINDSQEKYIEFFKWVKGYKWIREK